MTEIRVQLGSKYRLLWYYSPENDQFPILHNNINKIDKMKSHQDERECTIHYQKDTSLIHINNVLHLLYLLPLVLRLREASGLYNIPYEFHIAASLTFIIFYKFITYS